MGPKHIDIEESIPAAPSAVWALLDDSASWPEWTPIDSHEAVREPHPDGLGEVRIFRTGRHVIREEIVERRTEQRLSYVLLAGLALRDYRADIDLEQQGDATTLLRWRTTFRPKVPGTGWIYLSALRKATQAFVDGLARHAVAESDTAHRTGN